MQLPDADQERVVVHTRRAAVVLLVIGIVGFLIVGANNPANPALVPSHGIVTESPLKAFGAVNISVTPGAGVSPVTGVRCALLASTTSLRDRGLMGQRSLHGFVGMVFSWPALSTDLFYMRDTPMPLSIAWFDTTGRFLSSVDMPTCPAKVTLCPTYGPGKPYHLAIEAPRGGLSALGIGAGSVLQLAGPCVG